jgi:hypothetical protein
VIKYQLLAHGRWFSLGTPASFTTKTGRHDIAEILLNVALNKINQINQSIFLLQDKDLNYLLHGEKKKIRVLSLFDGIGTGIAYQLS